MNTVFLHLCLLLSQGNFGLAYGTPRRDYPGGHSCAEIHPGGYITVGHTVSASGDSLVLLIGIDESGSIILEKSMHCSTGDKANAVIKTSQGDYVLVGHTRVLGNTDVLAVKFSASGEILWAKVIEQNLGWDDAYCVIEAPDGGYLICGSVVSEPYAIKLSSAGELEWAKSYRGTSGQRYLYSATQAPNGGFVLAGFTDYYGAGGYDFLLLKIGQTGNLEWAKAYGGIYNDMAECILATPEGNFMVAGGYFSAGLDDEDFLLIKTDGNGNLLWGKAYGGENSLERPFALLRTSDGNYVMGGYTRGPGIAGLVAKFSNSGALLWGAVFDGDDIDWFRDILEGQDGSLVLFGGTRSYGIGDYDILAIRMPPDGSYPGCLITPSYQAIGYLPASTNISLGETALSPVAKDVTLTVESPGISTTEICSGQEVSENAGVSQTIRCITCSGSISFVSEEPILINIYGADGSLRRSEWLQKGQTRIPLGQGVYLWQAGPYKGKAVVR